MSTLCILLTLSFFYFFLLFLSKKIFRVLHHSYTQQTHLVFVWLYLKKYRDTQNRRISIESLIDCTVSHKREWSWCSLMKTTYGKKFCIFFVIFQTSKRIVDFLCLLARLFWHIYVQTFTIRSNCIQMGFILKVLFAYFSRKEKRKWSIAKKYWNTMVLLRPI